MTILKSIVNGEFVSSISINDRGFNYGDGLFETIALVSYQPVFWVQHYQRLVKGCEALGIKVPSESDLKNLIKQLYKQEKSTDNIGMNYVVKIIITRGEGERGYKAPVKSSPNVVLLLSTYPLYKKHYWLEGVRVKLCDTQLSQQQQLAGLKHLNRLEQVLARREWNDEYQEGLMRDASGNMIEGVMSNLFIVKDNVVMTPILDKAGVNGIMRGIILNICEQQGFSVKEEVVSLTLLKEAEEVFLSNSLIGVWPVKNIEDKTYPLGLYTSKIMQHLVKKYSVDYGSLGL